MASLGPTLGRRGAQGTESGAKCPWQPRNRHWWTRSPRPHRQGRAPAHTLLLLEPLLLPASVSYPALLRSILRAQYQRPVVKCSLELDNVVASSCKKFWICCQHLKPKIFHIKIENVGSSWKWENLAAGTAFPVTVGWSWGTASPSKTGQAPYGPIGIWVDSCGSAVPHNFWNTVTDSGLWIRLDVRKVLFSEWEAWFCVCHGKTGPLWVSGLLFTLFAHFKKSLCCFLEEPFFF